MGELIILIIICLYFYRRKKKKTRGSGNRPSVSRTFASVKRRKQQASAVPNQPRKRKRTREEETVEAMTRASRRDCHYEAAYSRGKPERLGLRGDYEPVVPSGMSRVRCGYCGAENFVPSGSHDHYHCYFCWEKL